MSDALKPIQVEFKHYRCFREQIPSSITLPVGGIVALTGVNNSGKSTALRFFYELKLVLAHLLATDGQWTEPLRGVINSSWGFQWQPVYGLGDTLEMYPDRSPHRPVQFKISSEAVEISCSLTIQEGHPNRDQLRLEKAARLKVKNLPLGILDALRIELVQPLSRILYIGPFRNIVNDAGGGTYYDLWNGSAFVSQWNDLKNGTDTLNAENAARIQVVVQELLGYQSLQIDASSDRKILFVTIESKRFSLSELGAGISQLILCLINVAVKRPSWILIDEPELHLHPAMQAKFVEALARFATHGVVFATHSIGLARTVADEVYVVTQKSRDVSTITSLKNISNYAQLLGELSFSQYEALGVNKILLVEGVTEVRTFHQLLSKFEARKVLVVPLGGSAMINPDRQNELAEFLRFGVGVYVLIDSERDHESHTLPVRDQFISVCESLFGKGHAIQTNLRATENYLPEKAIRQVMRSDKYSAMTPYQTFDSLEPKWSKNDNWKIAAETTRADWLGTDVGAFLAGLAEN